VKTIEISVKEIIVHLLYHWVPILLTAFTLAAFLGVYSYFSQKEILTSYDQELSTAQADAELAIAELEAKKIEADHLEEKNSVEIVLAKVKVSYLSFRISVNPVMIDINNVAKEYISLFQKTSLQDVFEEVIPGKFDENFLRYLVVLNEDKNGSIDPNDPGLMTIRALGSDYLDSSVLANTLFKYFVSKEAAVTLAAGQNTLSIVDHKIVSLSESNVDQKIAAELIAQADSKISSVVVAGDIQKAVNLLSKDELLTLYNAEILRINDGIATMQQQRPDIVSRTISVAGIGAIIGTVLGLLVTMIGYVFRLPVLIPEQPQTQLGIRYLGGIRRKKGFLFARLGDKLAGSFLLSPSIEETIAISSANIHEAITEDLKILFTGTVPLAIIREFAQRLKETGELHKAEFVVSDDVNKNADAIRKLSEADSVILVERLRLSTLRRIKQEQDRINVSGKRIVGYVLY